MNTCAHQHAHVIILNIKTSMKPYLFLFTKTYLIPYLKIMEDKNQIEIQIKIIYHHYFGQIKRINLFLLLLNAIKLGRQEQNTTHKLR